MADWHVECLVLQGCHPSQTHCLGLFVLGAAGTSTLKTLQRIPAFCTARARWQMGSAALIGFLEGLFRDNFPYQGLGTATCVYGFGLGFPDLGFRVSGLRE